MWIAVASIAYFLLALVVIIDKYLLTGSLPNPKLYAFAIGVFGSVVFVLLPFGFLEFPSDKIILLGIGAGVLQVFAILALFVGLKKFEASRIIPAIGGFLPIFTILFTSILGRGGLGLMQILAFLLLVGGSVLVGIERSALISFKSAVYAIIAALLFSLFVVFSKFIYEAQSFLSGLIWIAAGGIFASFFLYGISQDLRKVLGDMLRKKGKTKKNPSPFVFLLFLGNQALGSAGFVLQNWAIALTPFALIAFVNALEGLKYVFVFLIASFLSVTFPKIIKENISTNSIAQKALAIILVGVGLVLLAL